MRFVKWIVPVTIILFAYQNCSQVKFNSRGIASANNATSGNPTTGNPITPEIPNEPPVIPENPEQPVNPPVGKSIVRIQEASSYSSLSRCFIDGENDAYCIGAGVAGSVNENSITALRVPGNIKFKKIITGYDRFCGIALDDRGYCWGANYGGGGAAVNYAGQFGSGNTNESKTPVPVAGGLKFLDISMSRFHACGIAINNDLYCWGKNNFGELGNDTNFGNAYANSVPYTTVPVPVKGGLKFKSVAALVHSTCGVTTGGDVYCWGANESGILGTTVNMGRWSPMTNQQLLPEVPNSNPTKINGFSGATRVSTQMFYGACVSTASGSAFCWGPLGGSMDSDGGMIYSVSPLRVPFSDTVQNIVRAKEFDCSLDGQSISCWSNRDIRNGSVTRLKIPGNYTQISAGYKYACGLTVDQKMGCWNYDYQNQRFNAVQFVNF